MLHSKSIPPSSASMWTKCTAWAQMADIHPQEESEDTLQGEAVHEIAALDIVASIYPDMAGKKILLEGSTSSNGTLVSEEMVEAAEIYSSDFLEMFHTYSGQGDVQFGIEKRVDCRIVHESQSFGTPDAWLYVVDLKLLIVWDFKYGHLFVEAEENLQAINYVAGIIDVLEINTGNVEIRIVQPRTYHSSGPIRTWKTTIINLGGFFQLLTEKAAIVVSGNGELLAGNHCYAGRCQSRHACAAFLRYGMDLYSIAMHPIPQSLMPKSLGKQLVIVDQAMDALKGLHTALEAQIKQLQKSGEVVPGWTMEPSQGRAKWTKTYEDMINIGSMFGIDLIKKQLITPNQAEKAGLPDTIVAAYSERKQGSKLARDKNKVLKIFSKGE